MKKICCFAGHSELYDTERIYEKLLSAIDDLISTENIYEFWVGNYGDFDRLAAKAVRTLKEKHTKIELCLIIPYLTKEINECKESYYKNFDTILVADIPENTPKKAQIIRCNQYMVKNSHFMICFIKYSWGGASKTLEYAKKAKNTTIINLAEEFKQ